MRKKAGRYKRTACRDQRMQELRDILLREVPRRIQEIMASGKWEDYDWVVERLRWVQSVSPDELFDQGRVREWEEKMIESFAVLAFYPGGTTAYFGFKFLGVEFKSDQSWGV